MPSLPVMNVDGAKVGEIEVADDVFAAAVNEHLLWEAVRASRCAARAGTAKVKERGEINATKMKIYKQKGTGRARHGNRRVNLFRGGGVSHGPRPRSYAISVNRKAMAGALRSALSLRAKEGDLLVVRDFSRPEVKTKALLATLETMGTPKALLVDGSDNRWLRLSSRNLANANYLDVRGLNVYDILRFPKLIISEPCLREIEARLRRAPAGPEGNRG